MADLSLCLTNVSVSLSQPMDTEKHQSAEGDFESVEMGDLTGTKGRVKVPRRTIYFASGETMEEYSTDEEEEEEEPVKKEISHVDASKLTWGPYFWFHMWRMATNTISVCDYMGERLASLFGITTSKYQYAIDEYYRIKKEEEEEEEENRLAEEAERNFAEQQKAKQEEQATLHHATVEQPEAAATSFVNISFELEPEPALRSPDTNRVPSPLPS
ncbi:protein FAM177A1-like [Salarias fasciatus]|uniref:Protein FAM177A1-like n=1 Tax=Salarias fasciatus TaxID=181472 RepID=A0A672FT43_SALFA|nr:protein FAM177A1-like [Salarias fasciatus]XP_029972240.1 protein FAM177A1-like [Salarias fasciatus]